MNANAGNNLGLLRKMTAESPSRGQACGWSARLRMYGWRSTKRTATPPAKGRKHGSKAGRR